jgi:MFS family permease
VRAFWPSGGLWRHPDFLKLWSAETISQFGSQVGGFAMPLVAIITLEASPLAVSALLVVEFAPFLLISLPAGVWVDRLPRRPILIFSDFARAALLATIPIAYVFDVLTIWQLFVVGFLFGICTVFFDVAYQSYLPSIVNRRELVEGNSKLEISRSSAQLGGPAVAGVLVETIKAPFTILADAISFVASGLFVLRISKVEENVPTRAERKESKASMRTELGEGLRWVFGNPYLRTISSSTATFNLFGSMMWAILTIYLVRTLEMSPALIGIIFAIGQVGYLLGALTTNKIAARVGVGPAIVLGAMCGISQLLVPLAPQDANGAIPYLIVSGLIGGFGVVLYNVTQVSMRQAITPERLQGRMNSVIRFIVWGVMPIGQLTGGGLATVFDLRTAIWVGAIGCALAWVPLLIGPLRTLKTVPEEGQDEPRPGDVDPVPVVPGPVPVPEEP